MRFLKNIIFVVFYSVLIAEVSFAKNLTEKPVEQEIQVTVKGMVCAFCAQGIKKKLEKIPQIKNLKVSLEKNLVSFTLTDKNALKDDVLTDHLKDAGYGVEKIERK